MITLQEAVTHKTLNEAFKRVYRGDNRTREAAVVYKNHLHTRLRKLESSIQSGRYEMKPLHTFLVFEPKERKIIACEFEDKIVLDALANDILKPLISPLVIYDNYSSQDGKGTHVALHRLERHMRRYAKSINWSNRGWVYAYDIRKFFYTIDQVLCKSMVNKLDMDDSAKWMIYRSIEACTPELNSYTDEPGKGLCIGFPTSQWLSIFYLNGLDHFIKEDLQIEYYGRYADDFYIIHEDRDYLMWCNERIRDYIENKLLLQLNEKSHIHPFSQGVCFLGYHVTYDPSDHQVHTAIRSKSIDKMKRRTARQVKAIKAGTMTFSQAYASLESWHSYAVHGETNTAENAFEWARKQFAELADIYLANDLLRADWNAVDANGFFLVQPDTNAIRDISNNHFNLLPKPSLHDTIQEITRQRYLANPEEVIEENLDVLLHMDQYMPPKVTRKTIFRDNMHTVGLRHLYS